MSNPSRLESRIIIELPDIIRTIFSVNSLYRKAMCDSRTVEGGPSLNWGAEYLNWVVKFYLNNRDIIIEIRNKIR